MTPKRAIFTALLALVSLFASSEVRFTYDSAGNRISRTVVSPVNAPKAIKAPKSTAHPKLITSLFKQYAIGDMPQMPLGRGYCGHEHLPWFGLINMNSRLYDPVVSRFLSPDPQLQDPQNVQNYNTYSYAFNNPLKYRDPNGEFGLSIFTCLTDVIGNLFKHGLNVSRYNWKKTINAWRIDMGLFKGNFGQVLGKLTWGIHNTLFGNIVAQGYNLAGKVDNVTDMNGMLALSGGTKGESAFTIGCYSIGPKNYSATWQDHLFVHEYGHYIQSQYLGPAYLYVIGISSLDSAIWTSRCFPNTEHKYRWFEVWASRLGGKYMRDKYDQFDYDSFKGNSRSNYVNPRTNKRNSKGHPTRTATISFWDFTIL